MIVMLSTLLRLFMTSSWNVTRKVLVISITPVLCSSSSYYNKGLNKLYLITIYILTNLYSSTAAINNKETNRSSRTLVFIVTYVAVAPVVLIRYNIRTRE